MSEGTNIRKWVVGGLMACGILFVVSVLLPKRTPVEVQVLYRTNDVFGRDVVALTITNGSSKTFSVVAITEIMENAAWQQDRAYAELAVPVNGASSLRLDVPVPWEATRWLQIPMPPDASPVPWRAKVIFRQELAGAERILARGIEKLGLKYPWRRSFHEYLELGP